LTRVGRLALRIPRDRSGRFQPSLFERYERSEKALVLALAEMYVQGVSTRKVTHIVEQLCSVSVSASEVSVLAKKLDAELAAWRSRRLEGTRYPVFVIDAHHERVRRDGQVRSTAMLWVIGVSTDGHREHLGCWLGNSESVESWSAVLADLGRRGLTGVRYVVSDEHQGLLSALRRFVPDPAHQRCQVPYLRNALAKVSGTQRLQQLLLALRDVWAAPTRATATQRLTALAACRFPITAAGGARRTYDSVGPRLVGSHALSPSACARGRCDSPNEVRCRRMDNELCCSCRLSRSLALSRGA
ncbi:MAG: IS256 family transposase, partial [Gemmatimonadaceae bacterium]